MCSVELDQRRRASLQRAQPQLLEAGHLGLGEGLVGELRVRRAPPHRQRLVEGCSRLLGLIGRAQPGADQCGETHGVHVVGTD
jgi:hypothetical protein